MSSDLPDQYLDTQNTGQIGLDYAAASLFNPTADLISPDLILKIVELLNNLKGPDNAEPEIQDSPAYLRAQKTFHRYQTIKSQLEEEPEQPKDESSIEQLEMYKKELIESITHLENHLARLKRFQTIKESDSSEDLNKQIFIPNTDHTERYIRKSTSEDFEKPSYDLHNQPTLISESSLIRESVPKAKYTSFSKVEKEKQVKKSPELVADYNPAVYIKPREKEYHSQEDNTQKYPEIRQTSLGITSNNSVPISQQTHQNVHESSKNLLHKNKSKSFQERLNRESIVDYRQDVMGKPRDSFKRSMKERVIIPRKDDRRSSEHRHNPIRERIVIPPQAFGHQPVVTTCPACNKTGITVLKQVPSDTVWIVCVGCAVMGCAFGCCLIPFYIPSLSTWYHYCPYCRRQLGCKEAQGMNM